MNTEHNISYLLNLSIPMPPEKSILKEKKFSYKETVGFESLHISTQIQYPKTLSSKDYRFGAIQGRYEHNVLCPWKCCDHALHCFFLHSLVHSRLN